MSLEAKGRAAIVNAKNVRSLDNLEISKAKIMSISGDRCVNKDMTYWRQSCTAIVTRAYASSALREADKKLLLESLNLDSRLVDAGGWILDPHEDTDKYGFWNYTRAEDRNEDISSLQATSRPVMDGSNTATRLEFFIINSSNEVNKHLLLRLDGEELKYAQSNLSQTLQDTSAKHYIIITASSNFKGAPCVLCSGGGYLDTSVVIK